MNAASLFTTTLVVVVALSLGSFSTDQSFASPITTPNRPLPATTVETIDERIRSTNMNAGKAFDFEGGKPVRLWMESGETRDGALLPSEKKLHVETPYGGVEAGYVCFERETPFLIQGNIRAWCG